MLCASPTQADSAPQWRASAEFSLLEFGYKEFGDNDRLLDREDGTIPGVVFGLERREGPWIVGGKFSFHSGDVTYDGQTQSGIPIKTRTDQELVEIEARAEYWPDAQDRWALYGGLGYRYWGRDIRPTFTSSGMPVSGLYEVYDWWQVFLGTKAVLYDGESSRWLMDARVLRIVDPELRVDANSQFDEARLDLGERNGLRLSLPWWYELDKATRLSIEPYVEDWEFGRSRTVPATQNGVVVGTIFEPRSQTRHHGINLGFSCRF